MVLLVLANSWEYYYFGNYYKKNNVSPKCHTPLRVNYTHELQRHVVCYYTKINKTPASKDRPNGGDR